MRKNKHQNKTVAVVRLEAHCEHHGRHVVFMASEDDTAELMARWICDNFPDDSWQCQLEDLDPGFLEDLPF